MTFVVLIPLSMLIPFLIVSAVIEVLGDYLITIVLWLLAAVVVLFFLFGLNLTPVQFLSFAIVILIGAPWLGCYLHQRREQRELEEQQRQQAARKQQDAERWMLWKLRNELDRFERDQREEAETDREVERIMQQGSK